LRNGLSGGRRGKGLLEEVNNRSDGVLEKRSVATKEDVTAAPENK